jgi:hypothetical protein
MFRLSLAQTVATVKKDLVKHAITIHAGMCCLPCFRNQPACLLTVHSLGDDYLTPGTGLYLLGPMNGKVFLRNRAGEVVSAIWEDAIHETTSFRFSVARGADASLVAAILIAAGSRLAAARRPVSVSPESDSAGSAGSQLEDDARSGSPGASLGHSSPSPDNTASHSSSPSPLPVMAAPD